MANTPINLRIDDRTRAEVEALARGRGVSVSEIIRGAIETMLGRDPGEPPRESYPVSMTMFERRMLAMQHEILAHLEAPEASDFEKDYRRHRITALQAGYTGDYPDEFEDMRSELPARDCAMVWDLFDMFRLLQASIGHLDEAVVADLGDEVVRALSFNGFDANDAYEGRLLNYGRHLLATERWEELRGRFDAEHDRGNSHRPMLSTYQRMLNTYEPLRHAKAMRGISPDAQFLSADELMAVAVAGRHPEAG